MQTHYDSQNVYNISYIKPIAQGYLPSNILSAIIIFYQETNMDKYRSRTHSLQYPEIG